MNRANLPQPPGVNDLPHGSNMELKTIRVTCNQLHPVLVGSLNHSVDFFKRNRHGFFHHHMLAALKRLYSMLAVKPVWT